MMKKRLHIFGFFIFVLAGIFFAAHAAFAATPAASSPGAGILSNVLGFGDMWALVNYLMATMANMILWVASRFIAISGLLLNLSIVLTLHIKDLVDNTPGIYIVWQTIRDITGLFMIFFLLYAAFKMILGFDAKLGTLIKNIIIAGIFVNFSFFIVSVGIDASNIVSLQLFHAIAPNKDVVFTTTTGYDDLTASTRVGLSDIFMQSLKIQSIYNPKNANLPSAADSAGVSLKIIFIALFGTMIMITTGISFLLAAMAFTARLVVLIFLLAFSSIYFVSFISPELKKYADMWRNQLIAQMIFMPLYLLLTYAALLILTKSSVFLTKVNLASGGSVLDYVSLIINYVLAIIMLNLPLAVALKMGGAATGWLNAGKFDAIKAWEKLGGTLGTSARWAGGRVTGYVGTNTIGRTASNFDKYAGSTKLGNSLLGRDIRKVTSQKLAGAKMGGARSFEQTGKDMKDVNKVNVINKRTTDFNTAMADIRAGRPPIRGTVPLKDLVKGMSEGEKLDLDINDLTDENVIRYLKGSEFDAIKKSADMSEADKAKVEEARKTVFEDAVRGAATNPDQAATVKDMLQNYDGSDLAKMDLAILSNPAVFKNITVGQIKKIDDISSNNGLKTSLGNAIYRHFAASGEKVAAYGLVKKMRDTGSWGG